MSLPAASPRHALHTRLGLALFSGLIALALVVGLASRASTPAGAAPAASYSVQAGDSLYAISMKLGIAENDRQDWIEAVRRLNGLSSADLVQAGQVLTLPGSTAGGTIPASSQASAATTAGSVSYSVQTGDTLAAIATRLAVSEGDRDAWMARVV